MTESKAREFKEIKIPEIWVGFTKDNFARWMAAKDPKMDKCPFYFISEGGDKCVDVKVFVAREKVDQLQAELKAKDELLLECEKAIRHMHYCKYWLNKSNEDCDCNMHLIVEKLREGNK